MFSEYINEKRYNAVILRGEQVILDRDLAEMYGVETRVVKQAVRRNTDL